MFVCNYTSLLTPLSRNKADNHTQFIGFVLLKYSTERIDFVLIVIDN